MTSIRKVVQFVSPYFHLDHRTYHQNQQDLHLRCNGTPLSLSRKSEVRKQPTPPHYQQLLAVARVLRSSDVRVDSQHPEYRHLQMDHDYKASYPKLFTPSMPS